jgi:hypothetical protein
MCNVAYTGAYFYPEKDKGDKGTARKGSANPDPKTPADAKVWWFFF